MKNKWYDPKKEQPQDGDFITVVKDTYGCLFIEIAPWRDGEYQGSYKMATFFGQAEVLYWRPIPELPKKAYR